MIIIAFRTEWPNLT